MKSHVLMYKPLLNLMRTQHCFVSGAFYDLNVYYYENHVPVFYPMYWLVVANDGHNINIGVHDLTNVLFSLVTTTISELILLDSASRLAFCTVARAGCPR